VNQQFYRNPVFPGLMTLKAQSPGSWHTKHLRVDETGYLKMHSNHTCFIKFGS